MKINHCKGWLVILCVLIDSELFINKWTKVCKNFYWLKMSYIRPMTHLSIKSFCERVQLNFLILQGPPVRLDKLWGIFLK